MPYLRVLVFQFLFDNSKLLFIEKFYLVTLLVVKAFQIKNSIWLMELWVLKAFRILGIS